LELSDISLSTVKLFLELSDISLSTVKLFWKLILTKDICVY
jgi:hypothetical protein